MSRWLVRALGLAVAGLLLLSVVIAYFTLQYKPPTHQHGELFDAEVDIERAAQLLSQAVKFRTVSAAPDRASFNEFLTFLQSSFPSLDRKLHRTVIAPNTPLYRWQGSDKSLEPVLLAAHYDVVPIAAGSLDKWSFAPFSGEIADGFVWGRGTLDNKGALVAIMSAAEHLIDTGYTPKRTVYFSFGSDEEIGGQGAKAVAKYLRDQEIQLQWALDEGSFVLDDVVPGLDVPVASINLAEKGYLSIKLIARSAGGHSALPPRLTAVGRIAKAIDKLQSNPVPGGLSDVSAEFFDHLGRHFSLKKRVLFANRWLFSPLLENALSASATTNAMLRTTTAPTMLSGSNKENVLAAQATATVNFRIHPRDTIDSVIVHVRNTIADENIELQVNKQFASEASPVASPNSAAFRDIEASIRSVFGAVASVPGLTIAATDARYYATVSADTYRINPFMVDNADIKRFHGIDERLSIENLQRGISFYVSLLTKQ